jgi:hypothetical protein
MTFNEKLMYISHVLDRLISEQILGDESLGFSLASNDFIANLYKFLLILSRIDDLPTLLQVNLFGQIVTLSERYPWNRNVLLVHPLQLLHHLVFVDR